ncbi:MAG: copper oxidase [Alphaproteobacteria bacterium 41-28]|nr:MAG: copper oxidase [Alphaproteobacteria bacterium 41-28]
MKIGLWAAALIWISLSTGVADASSSKQPTILIVKKIPLVVNGKKTELFRIEQPDGTWGYHGAKGEEFDAIVKNQTDEPTVVHWHGLILPNNQDGTPITQPLIMPGEEYHYHFKLEQSGTYWMHSHYGLQIQQHLSAPFIISDGEETKNNPQDVTMFLVDFSYKNPERILKDLKKGMKGTSMKMPAARDLNDVKYDAYLTNYRTLEDPEIIRVTPGQSVRLRIINGAAATNFFVSTGKLKGEVIATDGQSVTPLQGTEFQVAAAQRLDVLVNIPKGEGVYPILAQGEGTNMQTGLVLATQNMQIPVLSEKATKVAGALNYAQERQYKALDPLQIKKPEQTLSVNLGGDMAKYIWMINNQEWPNVTPLEITPNKRVEIVFHNETEMAHPMHFHGHTFEVTEIDGKSLKDGPMRDTVLVLPHSTVKIKFDAIHPGNWFLHCHLVYHQEAGMMTYVNYKGFPFPKSLTGEL